MGRAKMNAVKKLDKGALHDKHHLHMVGIGGSGMSALAKILVEAGYEVSGSDLSASIATQKLAELGVRVHRGHEAEHVHGADLLIISSAIPPDNPERLAAVASGIRVLKRAEVLGELTRQRQSILVAGTHGKTTTTSMIALVLKEGGLEPTFVVGGEVANLGTSAELGGGNLLVAEADEFDGTFLKLTPHVAVITNVEADHLDFFSNIDAIAEAFGEFIGLVPVDGHLVVCWDDLRLRKLAARCAGHVASYGLGQDANWRALRIRRNDRGGNDFVAAKDGKSVGRFSLQVPGQHNVANALAAIATADIVGLDPHETGKALANFKGALRRFELKGIVGGVSVYDDYAHHPTEITATLRAARERHSGRIWAVFQPHTYNRTKHFLREFAEVLRLADRIIVTDVYMPPGREVDTLGVSSRDVVSAMNCTDAQYIGRLEDTVSYLCQALQPGDMLMTLGAGNIYTVGLEVLKQLACRQEEV
ncbi:MAG: UDP-N-acetylmuramate--L-alanine ligase [Chloroflexi bacterium]|nr:UDP-N-acetylmuramate--L-alanine ligase [Chloroflexota bacterium]